MVPAAILLDLDGTLTDPKVGITTSIAHALFQMARKPPPLDDLTFAIGPPLRASFAQLLDSADPIEIERAMDFYRERFSTVGLFENHVYPGVPAMLDTLKSAGARLFLATAKPHVYAVRILAHFHLDGYFEAVYGSELDGTRQHKSDLLAYLLAREGLPAAAAVMVGDRGHDIEAAQANGCRSVGVTWGYGNSDELAAADALCEAPGELGRVIGEVR